MAEHLSSPSEKGESEPVERSVGRYPTDEELHAFEEQRQHEFNFDSNVMLYGYPAITIEEYARDPENPTQGEIRAVEEINQERGPHLTSFEEYFGYPDPRKPEDQTRPNYQE